MVRLDNWLHEKLSFSNHSCSCTCLTPFARIGKRSLGSVLQRPLTRDTAEPLNGKFTESMP